MSATMARQGGQVQLEQCHMYLVLNMAKMAKGGFLRTAIEETQHLIKKPRAEVQEEKQQVVEFPGKGNVKAAIERHPAMVREYQTEGCLPCHNRPAKDLQTHCRGKGTGAPPAEPATHLPGMPPALAADNEVAQNSEIECVRPGYVCIHTPLPLFRFSILMHLPSIASVIQIWVQICWLMKKHPLVCTLSAPWWWSWHPFCRQEQPSEQTWQWWWALIERNWILEYYYYVQLADTLKYILKDIFIFIIKEQYSDKGKSAWRY